MIKLKVAGLVIAAKGFENDFFIRRTKDYVCDAASTDMSVDVCVKDVISRPTAEISAVRTDRYFCETEDEYIFYDMYHDTCIAVVRASKDWANVYCELVDVSNIGGAENDVRKFNMLGEVFQYRILEKSGIIYHSSTILYNDCAVCFTANSGTGKSTHTSLWKQHYGAEIINDDSPAIVFEADCLTVYGTPWSGKTEFNINVSVPLKALVFLERSEANYAEKLSWRIALPQLVHGMMLKAPYRSSMDKALGMIEKIAEGVPLYKLGCNISREAVDTIKNKIFG